MQMELFPRIVWNFPNAKNITMQRVGMAGSFVAVDAGTLHRHRAVVQGGVRGEGECSA
jgi:choice-of-anchor A domain-containing protein